MLFGLGFKEPVLGNVLEAFSIIEYSIKGKWLHQLQSRYKSGIG